MTPKEWRHIHGASGLNFDLADVRESYAVCVELEHLPELQNTKKRCEKILDEVEGGNYKHMYDSACASVTKRDIEIERLQREIYNMLPHDNAAAIINDCDAWVGRPVLRDEEAVALKQKLDAARANRDKVVAQDPEPADKISHAFRTVYAQGAVDQAKKALYIYLRKTSKSRYSHQDTKHRDL